MGLFLKTPSTSAALRRGRQGRSDSSKGGGKEDATWSLEKMHARVSRGMAIAAVLVLMASWFFGRDALNRYARRDAAAWAPPNLVQVDLGPPPAWCPPSYLKAIRERVVQAATQEVRSGEGMGVQAVAALLRQETAISRVNQVRRLADGRLVASLIWHKPVAAVYKPGSGYVFLDRQARVLLGPSMMEGIEDAGLPRFSGVVIDNPSPGHLWQDPGLQAGLTLLPLLDSTLRLYLDRILVQDRDELGRVSLVLALSVPGGTMHVTWGAAPGDERGIDALPTAKLAAIHHELLSDPQVRGGYFGHHFHVRTGRAIRVIPPSSSATMP